MSAVVQWKEPPSSRRGKVIGDNAPIAAELKSRPNEWALVWGSASSGHAQYIRSGLGAWAPAGAFETTTRKCDDGKFDIYVRYVGDPS